MDRAAMVEGINQVPHLARRSFVSTAIKKGMVHDTVICLAPVEEEKACKFALHALAPGSFSLPAGLFPLP
jgi:hypothetical protein